MKIAQFKCTALLILIFVLAANAQKAKKDFKEEFKVKPDVVIDVNTRHTDIEIVTWDKNEVVVEAFMKVEGEEIDNIMRDEFYDKWEFEAYGNSDKINVKSRSNSFIDIHSFNFDAPDYEVFRSDSNGENDFVFVMPDVSIRSLDILDSIDFVIPEIPELPELPEIPELPELNIVLPDLPPMPSKFDYEAYKKDKSYLERWKKENEELIGKNADVTVRKNSISIKSKKGSGNSFYNWSFSNEDEERAEEIAEKVEKALEKSRAEREKRMEELEKRHEERIKRHEERRKELKLRIKEREKKRVEQRKLALVKRQEAREKQRRVVQSYLKKRDDIKIKRHIVIRAPKDAKFNMNVRYGTLSFPK